MTKPLRSIRRVCAAAVAAAALAACSPPPLGIDHDGRGIEVTPLKSYGPWRSRFMLWLVGLKNVRPENTVDCYRVLYPSTDDGGHPIRLSGLLAMPRNVAPRGLVSFQHGTTSDRSFVPSNLSTDGLAAAVIFAGSGFATIAPDYQGLGASGGPHPYFVATDTARAVVDMIHAVRHIDGVPRDAPLLIGFSEGGYASLAAQRAMEATREPVLADAAIAGAYNLRTISLPWTLKGKSEQSSAYLALWVRGYAERYGHPLASVVTPRYAKLIPELFDTPHDADVVVKALPRNPREMFQPSALNALDGRGTQWLVTALAANAMSDWKARAPVRLYYGASDVDVPPVEAITTARQLSARGSSDVRAIRIGPEDHNQSVLVAAPLILDWFEALTPTRSTGAT